MRVEDKMKKENGKEFTAGAKAMFDYVMYRSANNYSGGSEASQKKCQDENRIVEEWIKDALEEVDEYAYMKWVRIDELQQKIYLLELPGYKKNI